MAEARTRALAAGLRVSVRWTVAPRGSGSEDGPARVVRVRLLGGGLVELTAARQSSAGSFGAGGRPPARTGSG